MSVAEHLAQRQLEAYNAHDIDSFCAVYSDDVIAYRLPGMTASISGIRQFREVYGAKFATQPELRVEILSRMVLGNKVVDHELVFGNRPEPHEVIAIYEVEGEQIKTVWFLSPA